MSRIWRTLKGYVLWTQARGSFHYDVMVTLILAFIFLAPQFIDFKDQRAENLLPRDGIVITPDGDKGFIYQVEAPQVDAQDESMVRVNFLRVLRPVAGAVTIDRVEPVRDNSGRIVAYRAWVHK
jgi:hypothetical protein